MGDNIETSVLVVGGGPVGMTLAMDLASRGIDVVVVEKLADDERPEVKCNSVAARSMEVFRRLGCAPQVRAGGMPASYSQSASYRTTTTGAEMSQIWMPPTAERYTATGGPDCDWPTPEPQQHINQLFLNPILRAHLRTRPGIRTFSECVAESLGQDVDGVTAIVESLHTDMRFSIRARYLVGCDGGRSMVRRTLGIRMVGDVELQRVQSTFLRAPSLISLMQAAPSWCMTSFNPRRCGNVYSIDGRETFLVFNYLREDEQDFETVDRDRCIRDILGVGPDFAYDIISKEDWIGRRMIAERFRDRRVFVCGDAAHIWVPYGGYGMNCGIADAANLAWLLAAHLQGWAPEAILSAHEAERYPVTEQVSRFAMGSAFRAIRMRRDVPSNIEDPGPEGQAIRAEIGAEAKAFATTRLCAAGLNFGYFYDQSPIVVYDGETPPSYTMHEFISSTVPGCRVPHFWLPDRRSLYDAMGQGYALLRRDPTVNIAPLIAAFADRRVPVTVLDIDTAPPEYRHKLLLARPDQHVAWRGDAVPTDPAALVDLLRGARIAAPAERQSVFG